jgi:hypothetical protein
MRAVAFETVPAADWDYAHANSDEAWLYHRRDWVLIEQGFHLANKSIAALGDDDAIVGILPLYVARAQGGPEFAELVLHSGMHRHAGPAIVNGLTARTRREIQACLMQRVFDIAAAEDADRIQLSAHNLAPALLGAPRGHLPYWVEDYGFQSGISFGPGFMMPCPGMSTCCADQIVDLSRDVPTLFDALDPSCRKAVRKANSFDLSFGIDPSNEAPSRYYALAERSVTRTGEILPQAEYYTSVHAKLAQDGRASIGFVTHQGRDVAAIFLLIDKGGVNFMAGVSDPDALPMRVNDFMHWQTILHCRSAGFARYRLGPIFPEIPKDWTIARVSAFKAKFGGTSAEIVHGSFFLRPEKYMATGRYLLDLACSRSKKEVPTE